jgi:hypothetical protein
MPTLIYFHAHEEPLYVEHEVEDVVRLFEATPDKPVRLAGRGGQVVFASWRNVGLPRGGT